MIVQEATSVIESAADLAAIANDWNALLDDSAQSAFSVRPLWLLAWWRHFAPRDAQLRAIACRDAAGALIGFAPLYFDPAEREVRFIGVISDTAGDGVLPTNLTGSLIARRGSEAAAVAAIADALEEQRDWTRLWLARLRPEHETVALIAAALPGRTQLRAKPQHNLFVDTRGDWETYRAALGAAGRKRIQCYARRAAERECAFRRVASADELARAFALYLRWHAALLGGRGVYSDPACAAFLRDVIADGFAEGRVRVWIAELDGAVVAVDIGLIDRGQLVEFQGHADPAHPEMRLGHVMTSHVLRDCFEDPAIDEVVLGKAAPHKLHWSRESWGTVDLICAPGGE
jgi:CelD/BcsL family acetyltransferase involved in cellulose biosynthesis